MRPRTQARNRKTPEMLQSLLDLKTRLQAAPHGGQRALVEEFAASVGKSCATVYKWLTDEVGYSSGRKPRADAGTTRLAPDVLQFVAAAKQESIRANGKATMGTPVARLFLEPQKTMVTSSSLEKPSLRLSQVVKHSARARITAHTTSSPASAGSGIWRHSPSTTAALNAV